MTPTALLLALGALLWGLLKIGAVMPSNAMWLFLALLPAVALTWLAQPAFLLQKRLLGLHFFGAVICIQVIRLSAVDDRGWILLGFAWAGIHLGLIVANQGQRVTRAWSLALIAIGAVQAFWGLTQVFGPSTNPATANLSDAALQVAHGSVVNRNHFAGMVNLTLGLAIGMLWYGFTRRRHDRPASESAAWAWLVTLGGAFMGLAVLLSQSRGGATSLLLMTALAAGLLTLARGGRRSSSARVLPAILLLAILGVGFAVGIDALLGRFGELDEREGRLQTYRDTVQMIADEPIIGVGPGMYRWRFRPYQSLQVDRFFFYAHNDYLQAAAEYGLPLALLLWAFVFWRFERAARRFLNGHTGWKRGAALGCAVALFSILLHSLVDFNLQIPTTMLLFASVLGVAWGLELGTTGREAAGREAAGISILGRPALRTTGAAVTLLLAATAWTLVPQARSATLTDDLNDLTSEEQIPTETLERALDLDGRNADAHRTLGVLYRDAVALRDLARAAGHLEQAAAINPWDWKAQRQLGALYELGGNLKGATTAYGRAIELNPGSSDYRWRFGNFLLRLAASETPSAENGEDLTHRGAEQLARAVALDGSLAPAALSVMLQAGAGWRTALDLWPQHGGLPRRLLSLALRPPPGPETLRAERIPPPDLLGQIWRSALEVDPELEPEHSAAQPLRLVEGTAYINLLLQRARGETIEADGGGESLLSSSAQTAGAVAARKAWLALTETHGLEDPAYASDRNLVWNGAFDLELANTGLGWAVRQADGFAAARDETDDLTALQMTFDGTQNVNTVPVQQRFAVPSVGPHRLRARIRTERITTDEGVFLEAVTPVGLLWRSEQFRGTSDWVQLEADLDFPSATTEVTLRLRRNRSLRIDNRISGTLWLDDVELRPLSRRPGEASQ